MNAYVIQIPFPPASGSMYSMTYILAGIGTNNAAADAANERHDVREDVAEGEQTEDWVAGQPRQAGRQRPKHTPATATYSGQSMHYI